MNDYFSLLEELALASEIVIDRPKGSAHPRSPDVIYPLDYGYLAGTQAADGSGIDVFVGSDSSVGVNGLLLTLDSEKRESEIKVLVNCTDEEVGSAQRFLNDVLCIGGLLVRRSAESLR
ncbi:MAG: inorganic pyrophosphatase [Actinobacteria bacterium]|nr:inorganic pyrophosphatase [Actinomycetota bacterium]